MSLSSKWNSNGLQSHIRFHPDEESPVRPEYPPEQKRDWRRNFIIVTLPFVLTGFPLNLMLWESEDNETKYMINSTSSWLLSFIKPIRPTLIFTIIFFLLSLATYYIIIEAIYHLFYDLLYLAVLTPGIFDNLANLVRYFPLGIPLVMAWVWGYNFKYLVQSFDTLRADFEDRLNYSWRIPPTVKSPFGAVWVKLVIFYLMILIIQAVILLLAHFGDSASFKSELFWVGFTIQLMYNLMFPVYGMCCLAIQTEFHLLSLYLDSLVRDNFRPTFRIFSEIKELYKNIAAQVAAVNAAFGIYMSFVIVVTLSTAYFYFGIAGLQVVPYVTQLFASGMTQDPSVSSTFDVVGPPIMRTCLANVFLGLLHLLLPAFTAFQAIKVNSSARYIHVLINDFVTHASATVMTPELYQSYRLLKFYIHSTMEQIERPALLRIAILNYVPYFGTRLHTYNLRF